VDQKAGREPTLRETKTKLLEAAQAAVLDQRTKALNDRRLSGRVSRSRGAFRMFMGTVLLAGAGVLATKPAWLTGPAMPPETVEVKQASVLLSLVEAMSHVNAYVEVNGKLPPTLREAGVINPAIRYSPDGEVRFSLSLQTADSTVTLSSSDSLLPRVVNALRTLQRRT
jgi:hypothetical protein